ncbi:MAG: hypothetical protein UR61_C0001G0006 [candidate division WS6 bacterium GW2011_GWE1_34_7]|uniref:Uncharacterized protein n=1 Tax=candidate division WS6 bacterium GW2011_GWE1_34_7 TaxID=1619093 RepID=A0A0G0BA31_9BACT|nr:MAG: hypothetical protein UR61_C0001G0006 [candidate division WS6 bacterium GW2011_GWE1_34_7]
MEKRKTRLHAFSLVEMLLVMGILVIFGAFGTGGFLGFRETMFVKENVEVIKQDVLLAQQKSMLLERETGDSWIYGVGLDLTGIVGEDGTYKMFRWCSPFADFGNSITRSKLLGWDSTANIGVPVTPEDVLGVSKVGGDNLIAFAPVPVDPIDSCVRSIRYCPTETGAYQAAVQECADYCATICIAPECTCTPVADSGLCTTEDIDPPPPADDDVLPPPPTESEEPVVGTSYINGYLPLTYTSSCALGATSLVEITGEAADRFVDAGTIQLLGATPVKYVVFEAVTGKAFLYDGAGKPVNYSSSGSNLFYDGSTILDIAILRGRSSKFDVISIYPSSGTVVHHVYTDADKAPSSATSGIITVNSQKYFRFGVFDDISSYRD